jgi:hypothetical protein
MDVSWRLILEYRAPVFSPEVSSCVRPIFDWNGRRRPKVSRRPLSLPPPSFPAVYSLFFFATIDFWIGLQHFHRHN